MAKSRKNRIVSWIARMSLVLGIAYSVVAHAEFSVAALGGTAGYTTQLKGDAIHAYGSSYFSYPADVNHNQWVAGLLARYTHPVPCHFFLGAETGYVYLGVDQTRQRADNVISNTPVWVENFTTKSTALVLFNIVAGYQIVDNVKVTFFAGPAWLDTKYVGNDFSNVVTRTTSDWYQLTADTGMEADWDFFRNWSAGMRFDYIYLTGTRTVGNIGSLGTPLTNPMTAKSSMTLFSLNIRYLGYGTFYL